MLLQDIIEIESDEAIQTSLDMENVNVTKKKKAIVLREQYNYHYVYIKNLSRLVGRQVSKKKIQKYFCDNCFNYLPTIASLKKHLEKCLEVNECEIILPNPDYKEEYIVKFRNHNNKIPTPFVIYSDFESLLTPIKDDKRKEILHEPLTVGYYFHCR